MGFFDSWKVVNITTDASKYSEPFYLLALNVDGLSDDEIPLEHVLACANMFLRLKDSFDCYFNQGIKSEKNDAIKFLAAFASYALGKDREMWDWQLIRHKSQGLYGSMEESPAHFLHFNSPLINSFADEVQSFVREYS
jgi:hypothetical protein